MGELIELDKFRKTNKQHNPPPDPSLQERIERIKSSINRIDELMTELKIMRPNRSKDVDNRKD